MLGHVRDQHANDDDAVSASAYTSHGQRFYQERRVSLVSYVHGDNKVHEAGIAQSAASVLEGIHHVHVFGSRHSCVAREDPLPLDAGRKRYEDGEEYAIAQW